jgi:Fe-S cluster assembly protein SufD
VTAGASAVAKAAFDPVAHYLGTFEQSAQGGARLRWLRELRERAADRFRRLGFPKSNDEDWRGTNLAPLVGRPFAPAARPTLAQARESFAAAGLGPARGVRLLFVDGVYFPELSQPVSDSGVVAGGLASVLAAAPERLQEVLLRSAEDRAFTALNTAFLADGAFVSIPRGASVEEAVELVYLASEPAFIQPRNVIAAEPGSSACVVERYLAAGGASSFTNAVTQIALGDGACLDHYRLEREAPSAFHVSQVEIRAGAGAQVSAHSYSAGAALVRNDVAVRLEASGARASLFGLSVTSGAQAVDNHTCIEHVSPRCSSEESYRAILDGTSKSVFHGRVIVHEGAQKTDATQSNKSLLLSEEATASAKPQLEIHADDVKCTHGAAVGQLDKEAIFYLRSRGVGEREARTLLTRAFASQVIGKVRLGWLQPIIEGDLFAGVRALQGESPS